MLYQLGALDAFARAAGTRVRYVKPHGALYNTAMDDDGQARAVVDAVVAYDPALPLLGLPSSRLERVALDAGIPYFHEAFADRRYTPSGRLVDRSQPGAVLTDPDEVVAQAVSIVRDGRVLTADGPIEVDAQSLCLHGDTPGAVAMAAAVRAALGDGPLRPFVE